MDIELGSKSPQAHRPNLIILLFIFRYLATGQSYKRLMYGFRVPHNTISLIVPEVFRTIIVEYADEVIVTPITQEEWLEVAQEFSSRWNFHHALGALDGKNIAIRCPRNRGSLYYNYKGFYSIVMLALVDPDYKSLWLDIGSNGSASDVQVFNTRLFKELIESGEINFPLTKPLPHDDKNALFLCW